MISRFQVLIGVLLLSTVPLFSQAAPAASPATSDVLKLARSGVGDDVLLGFVQNEKGLFRLGTDDILALKDAHVGSDVIKAMLTHDAAATQAASAQAAAPAPAPAAAPVVVTPPPVVLDPNPSPPVVVVPYYRPYPYPLYYHHPYWHRRGGIMVWGW